jgi:hypothetical protein
MSSIAAVGLNTIRVQIGCTCETVRLLIPVWSVIPLENNEPYLIGKFPLQGHCLVSGAYDYLKLAVGWAASLNLKVMIDLHGVPGVKMVSTTREPIHGITNSPEVCEVEKNGLQTIQISLVPLLPNNFSLLILLNPITTIQFLRSS